MKNTIKSLALGSVAFVLSFTVIIPILLAVPGLIIGINALKDDSQPIKMPVGYAVKIGEKEVTAQPFFSSKYLTYIAIGINAIGLIIGLLTLMGGFMMLSELSTIK